MIELTEEQQKELCRESPPRVMDPRTRQKFVLIREDVYEAIRKIVEPLNKAGWDDPSLDVYEAHREGK